MHHPLIIDTREEYEFTNGHVDGAINIPPMEFMDGNLPTQLQTTPKDQAIIVYCVSGSRANVVNNILRQHGFTNLKNGIHRQQVERSLA